MSSASVRAAVASFFQATVAPGPNQIPGLNKVHSAPPYWADGSEWNLANELGSGTVAGVHLVEDSESRITIPVLTGQKMVTYKIGLMLFYQFLLPSNTLTPIDEAAWADPLDATIDGIKARLRSDPNCGLPSVVWQAAQDPGDVKIVRDIPRRLPGKVVSWNVIEFMVDEVVTA